MPGDAALTGSRADCPSAARPSAARPDEAAPPWLTALVEAALADQRDPIELDPYAHTERDGNERAAAVLIAFCETPDGPGLLVTERAMTLRAHAGQVAFPGGAADPGDRDAAATALREAAEEVGLDPTSVRILAQLPTRYLRPSNFLVTPVIGWWVEPHPVAAIDEGEVARAVVVTITELTDPANRFSVAGPRTGRLGPGFDVDGLFVWGFTAVLIDYLLDLGGRERPWDRERARELPVRRAW